MINRELIRLKVVQLTYAHYQNGSNKLDLAEKELAFSLSKAYDLYIYMLALMVEVNRLAERGVETAMNRYRRLGEGEPPSTKFIDNRFMAQLQTNRQLLEFTEGQKKTWDDEEDFVRRLYKQVLESDIYKEWMADRRETTYEEDRDFWRRLYRGVFVENEDLDQILEDKSLYWNDDRFIVDTFVLKTIRQFDPKLGARQPLLPEFKDEEDRDFATRLFRASLLGAENYRQMIAQALHHWELNRLALMDLLVMQIALAEICTFPAIPISVSINEYVEIAKMYSTPQSGRYVNGLLDAIARRLVEEGKVRKLMPDSRTTSVSSDKEEELEE
jgi:N utilization substance protein B